MSTENPRSRNVVLDTSVSAALKDAGSGWQWTISACTVVPLILDYSSTAPYDTHVRNATRQKGKEMLQ